MEQYELCYESVVQWVRENSCWGLFSLLEVSSVGLNVDVAGEVRAFYHRLPGLCFSL